MIGLQMTMRAVVILLAVDGFSFVEANGSVLVLPNAGSILPKIGE
jgi:hypothetical protein